MREGFENGSLWHKRSSEIEDIPFNERNLLKHFFFISIKDFVFHFVYLSYDIIKSRETGFKERFEKYIEEMRGTLTHMKSSFSYTFLKHREKFFELKNMFSMSGNKMCFGKEYVYFSRVGGTTNRIEEGNVDSEI